MKKLLLCLALLLVPTSLMACPTGPTCGGQDCAEAAPVNVDEAISGVCTLIDDVARRNIDAINQLGQETGGLVMEVQFAVEDEKVVGKILQDMQRAELLFKLALDELSEAGKLSALASLEQGPAAASLRLAAASKTSTAIGYLLRCGNQLQGVRAEALAALTSVEVEDEGPTAELPPNETAPNDGTF